MAPSGNSAMIVTASLPACSLPAAAPPSLRKSLSLIAESLPAPTTIRRETLRPFGARRSSVDPLLPLNRLVSAARLTRSAAAPSLLRVAVPNFSVSSENITRTPRGPVENGIKPAGRWRCDQRGSLSSGIGRQPQFRIAGRGDRAVTMGSIDKYIFRTTLASFALVLVSLTGVIWITQALRGIDLMTSQGQTIITFLGVTSLVIPALVLIISPIALMIAISHTLNKLATDSEIIVMNAAGFSPLRLFRPFIYATIVVAVMVAFIASYLAPDGMRRLKQWDAEITADVLANILQPGRFAQLDQNLTIRIRERQPSGVLVGIFVDDRRDPKERVSIIADHGTILKNEGGSFLILEEDRKSV